MKHHEPQILLLAGIYNSKPNHWQTVWQQEDPALRKLEHADWDTPNRIAWVCELENELDRLPLPSTVVSNTSNPYGTPEYMEKCASSWGSQFVSLGSLGHINASSSLFQYEMSLK
jgi:predicted alpha/beta hydrolase family esterase